VNIVMSVVVCSLWGYLLYTGNITTLWRMLGIANQLLATIALVVGTTYLLNHAPKRSYALLTALPLLFVIVTVFAAGYLSIAGWLRELQSAPAAEAFQLKLMCTLASVMLGLTIVIVADALYRWWMILSSSSRGPIVTGAVA
jgi:carbon starvation protein